METSAWIFDLLTSTWAVLPNMSYILFSAPHRYQNFIIGIGSFADSIPARSSTVPLIAIRPACFAGQYSEQFSEMSCLYCQKGYLAHEASSACSKCPTGTTTNAEGSVSINNCTCERGYCMHGHCSITLTPDGRKVVCSCDVGFTGERCEYPTYYLIGLGGVLVTVIITVLITVTIQMIKHRREKTMVIEELEEMTRVWNVKEVELQLIERIDRDVPGGFGEVYRADYREIIVAVKKLQVVLDSDELRQEFAHEIEFMRSIRHPTLSCFLVPDAVKEKAHPFLSWSLLQGDR